MATLTEDDIQLLTELGLPTVPKLNLWKRIQKVHLIHRRV